MDAKEKAEDLLAVLFWGLDLMLNRCPARLFESSESWAYRNGFRPDLQNLRRCKLIERCGRARSDPYRLTAKGHLALQGGADPGQRWQRPWDGQWRMLFFDIPVVEHPIHVKLWRWLRRERFGYLQNSVWISPDPVDESALPLDSKRVCPGKLLVMLGCPGPNSSHADIVQDAWDFDAINQLYQDHRGILADGKRLMASAKPMARQIRNWLARERMAWQGAVAGDPLLPQPLLPEGYLGRTAWLERQAVMREVVQGLIGQSDENV